MKVSQLVFHEFRENGDVIEYSISNQQWAAVDHLTLASETKLPS